MHIAMHSSFTNKMGCSKELSDLKGGTVIGCHLCNKTAHEISSQLDIVLLTVSVIIGKWKHQPQDHKKSQNEVNDYYGSWWIRSAKALLIP